MKRIPPSIRMKEEVDQLLRGEAVEGAAPETAMRGFVRLSRPTRFGTRDK